MEKQLSEYPIMEDYMTMDSATAVPAVYTATAVGNSTDNVDDNYADADTDDAKAAAAVGAAAAHVDCTITDNLV